MFTQPPRQSSLPVVREQRTPFQTFNNNLMARVEKTDNYATQGKIEVIFLNRTKPVPIWTFDGPKPEVGDYVLVGYIDGQKNNPYMQGIFANTAWTSNFIRVEKDMIRIQFPTDLKDVRGEDATKENDPKSHLRDDTTYLSTRGYIQIDASGVQIHAPEGVPITFSADSILVTDSTGTGVTKKLARTGDPVLDSGGSPLGVIGDGSSRIEST